MLHSGGVVSDVYLRGLDAVMGERLEPEQLNEGRDLALTTDFRSVFSEVAFKHLGAAKMDVVFPGFNGTDKNWLGVLG